MKKQWHEELDINELASRFGSPIWVIGKQQIKENVRQFLSFTNSAFRILYPVKCNPAPSVLECIAEEGCGADCSSLSEINLALISGFKWENIAYNSPSQDFKTVKIVLDNGGIWVCDDVDLLKEIDNNQDSGKGQIWIRINPKQNVSYSKTSKNQELMAHGSSSSKFGIPEEDLPELLSKITIKISGLHLHVGTQMDNLDSFVSALNSLHENANIAIELGHPIKHLDIGGGLGIPFNDQDNFPSIFDWTSRLNQLKQKNYEYYTEPGHALVGDAVGLITTVKSIKHSRGKTWGICDVGTDQLAKITLLHWPHKVVSSSGSPLPFNGNDTLAGPLCFAGDNLLESTCLKDVKKDDRLLITNVGAYTFALSNSFNGRIAPAWLLWEEGAIKITEAESAFSRLMMQNHYWKKTIQREFEQPISRELFEALKSDYLHTEIENDRYTILEFNQIGENKFNATVDFISSVDFVSMPTAIRVIGNLCLVAALHKHGYTSKNRPVMGKKVQLEYGASLKTGLNKINIFLSDEIRKEEQSWTVLASFEVDDKSCKGCLILTI